jgi:uncharacterized secreted protein with C-terminal beta-propeller domain
MDIKKPLIVALAFAIFSVLSIVVLGFASLISDVVNAPTNVQPLAVKVKNHLADLRAGEVKRFASEEEFRKYLENARGNAASYGGFGMGMLTMTDSKMMSPAMGEARSESVGGIASSNAFMPGTPASPRVSETNVQVAGIDEPDIVKTDGRNIYFSREQFGYFGGEPVPMMKIMAGAASTSFIRPDMPVQETDVLSALPPEKLAKIGKIDRQGEMLLIGGTLVVFSGNDIVGYDVTDPSSPKEAWMMSQKDGAGLVQAREANGRLYLVEKSWVGGDHPCLFEPLTSGMTTVSVRCTDIYHPTAPSDTDAVFTVVDVDPATGTAGKAVSFTGSAGNSIVYMSPEAIYVTYETAGDTFKAILGFFKESKGLLPDTVLSKLEQLEEYGIGSEAKMVEYENILQKFFLGMDGDARLKWQTDESNQMSAYGKKHRRDLLFTGIVKIDVDTFGVVAQGKVPGHILNQFSLDEYGGNLRVATTVGGSAGRMLGLGNDSSANDVYVLDGKLNQSGLIEDLGAGERIYSARFVGDKGYLVTFRETDPFYVLDLSNPAAPRKAGELKIPGYSSYLHPLEGNLMLGIGKEDNQVKLSLFDVSSPDDPKEVSKYVLDEYWSESLNNHHAFLADPVHKVFFLPGSKGGYVFSYGDDTLTLEKTAKDDSIKRALFIGDNFYILATDAVYVYGESDWQKISSLSL